MKVGILQIELAIDHSGSLKDKRRVVRSIKDRVRRRFNVSIAETSGLDIWNRAMLSAAAVSGDGAYVHGQLDAVLDLVRAEHDARLVDWAIDVVDSAQLTAGIIDEDGSALWTPDERREENRSDGARGVDQAECVASIDRQAGEQAA